MEIDKMADLFKALGDPTRLKIISLLRLRDFCVCELVPIFNISQPAISKHMSRLKTVGLIKETRKGQWVFYSLNRENFDSIPLLLNHLPDMLPEVERLEREGSLVECD